jgi:hypothetical protein
MNGADYKAGVLSTESVPNSLEINQLTLHSALTLMIAATKIGDLVKRKLFYGKDIPVADMTAEVNCVANMASFLAAIAEYDQATGSDSMNKVVEPVQFAAELAGLPEELHLLDLSKIDIRLLHASLGIFTEGGELVEMMVKQYEGLGLDKTDMVLEFGDVRWYETIGLDAIGVSEETCRRMNNQKLLDKKAGRYTKGAFTMQDAIERDTVGEKAAAEKSS